MLHVVLYEYAALQVRARIVTLKDSLDAKKAERDQVGSMDRPCTALLRAGVYFCEMRGRCSVERMVARRLSMRKSMPTPPLAARCAHPHAT
jgi:hypothetical protein